MARQMRNLGRLLVLVGERRSNKLIEFELTDFSIPEWKGPLARLFGDPIQSHELRYDCSSHVNSSEILSFETRFSAFHVVSLS